MLKAAKSVSHFTRHFNSRTQSDPDIKTSIQLKVNKVGNECYHKADCVFGIAFHVFCNKKVMRKSSLNKCKEGRQLFQEKQHRAKALRLKLRTDHSLQLGVQLHKNRRGRKKLLNNLHIS
ncbi:hypothetical protein CHARACLAT_001845 [Characodon lateralis]|uniref:Uncharacterized protein n=1 Tax=Characodon lateralis TaxID=208331 RepID=A0ABU7CTZ3_9TELE|nr:hypothetical protein [Characodon lateralis]